MFASILKRLGAALVALFLITTAAAAADSVTFTGQVTYRERIALPPDAALRISLVAIETGVILASATAPIAPPGQVPLQFTLNVRSGLLKAGAEHGLIAELLSAGRAIFRNVALAPVDAAAPQPAMIVVSLAPPPAEPELTLLDTPWQARAIAGAELIAATSISLAIAPDRRAGGHGGCNSYFVEASVDGSALSFGPVAGTRMACAPQVMAQEAAFFAALQATARYAIEAQTLTLFGADGTPLVRLVRGQ